jgi:hypothetical protein
VFELKRGIVAGDRIKWNGIGVLTSGLAGEIRFDPELKNADLGAPPVKAEKILRENVEHSVRVGEDQKTSAEMREYFTQSSSRKTTWWVWAIALGLLIVMFLGWYFSTHGFGFSALGNQRKASSF